MITAEELQAYMSGIQEYLTSRRRHLHAHPELSFREEETAGFIAAELRNMGITPRTGVGGHGVVADLPQAEGDHGGLDSGADADRVPHLLLRADIDALPVTEQTELSYASENPGVMHACGHDIHTTCLLGATRFFVEHPQEQAGTIRVIFQPAEEKLPGGAASMIRDGVLQAPVPRAAIGQHINPELPVGTAGFRSGPFMASVDDLHFTVNGRGGHAAHPEELVDPVVIAAQLITSLQSVVSRNAPRGAPTALSIGRVHADGATNIIPDTVELHGTFRSSDESWRAKAHKLIRTMAQSVAQGYGGSCDVEITHGFPSLINNPDVSADSRRFAGEYLGEDKLINLPMTMGGEDFAYYAQEVPSCFYNLGITDFDVEPSPPPLHSPRLKPSEAALPIGAGLMAWIALRTLQERAVQEDSSGR